MFDPIHCRERLVTRAFSNICRVKIETTGIIVVCARTLLSFSTAHPFGRATRGRKRPQLSTTTLNSLPL